MDATCLYIENEGNNCKLLKGTGPVVGADGATGNLKCYIKISAAAALPRTEKTLGTDKTMCYSKAVPALAGTTVDESGFP